jgi:hypothetical protein
MPAFRQGKVFSQSLVCQDGLIILPGSDSTSRAILKPRQQDQETDVMILKIFLLKIWQKWRFRLGNKARLCKNFIITLVFEKNSYFFAENCQKSQKIVIITSVPDEFVKKIAQNVAQPVFLPELMHIPYFGKSSPQFLKKF